MSSLGLTVPSGRGATLPRTSTTILRSQRFRRLQGLVAAFRGKNHLGLAVAVAEVDEQHAAMVAVRIDPAAKGHLLSDVVQTQFAAGMSPQQVSIPANKGSSENNAVNSTSASGSRAKPEDLFRPEMDASCTLPAEAIGRWPRFEIGYSPRVTLMRYRVDLRRGVLPQL